jgi:UDP-N-acetylglucosamine 3-dehydrogenase
VIGCGWAGHYHAQAYTQHPQVQLVAVCDLVTDRAEAVAARYRCQAYTSVEEMLSQEKIDVASVATTTETHFDLVQRCLRAGAAVFCEKPLTQAIPLAESMVRTAAEARLPLGVNFNQRFAAGYLKAKQWASRAVRIHYISALLAQNVPLAQTEELRSRLPRDFLIFDAASHLVDLFRYFMGDPDDLCAYASPQGPEVFLTDLSVNLRFASGSVGSMICSFAGPEWGQLPIGRLEIASESERLVVDNLSQAVSWFGYRDEVVRTWRPSIFEPTGYGESMLMSIQAWIDAFLQGQPPPVDGKDGMRTLQLCEQIKNSVLAQAASNG